MEKKINLIVLCGGESPEHEVSLSSGRTCSLNFDQKYNVKPAVILKNGRWIFAEKFYSFDEKLHIENFFDMIMNCKSDEEASFFEKASLPIYDAIEILQSDKPDLMFLILHGERGEDGTIQGLLEFLRLPYTGSGVLASSLGMDKNRFQKLLDYHKIKIPKHVVIYEFEKFTHDIIIEVETSLGYPCIVKPSRCGSSVGMGIAKNGAQLESLIIAARKFDPEIIIEEYIKGIEITCGLINSLDENGEDKVIAFLPTEICPKEAEFFDYESKYTAGKTDEITPARLSQEMTETVRRLAEKVFRLSGAKGFSRVDMIIKDSVPYVLEINTLPGMTPTSLLPQGAKAVGLAISELLNMIVEYALRFPQGAIDKKNRF